MFKKAGYLKQVAATPENLHTKISTNVLINNYFQVIRNRWQQLRKISTQKSAETW
jgi:hypothetical protein